MTKKERVRGCLQTIKNNYALTQAGILLLALPDALSKCEEYFSLIADHPETQHFSYITYVLKDDQLLKLSTNQLRKSVLRNCIKESFELLKNEFQSDEEKEILINAPWYKFLRMIRNSLSHDFKFRFREYDKSKLPVRWADLTITLDMDNEFLPMEGFLTREKVLQLIDEIIDYVEKNFS